MTTRGLRLGAGLGQGHQGLALGTTIDRPISVSQPSEVNPNIQATYALMESRRSVGKVVPSMETAAEPLNITVPSRPALI